MEDFVEKHEAKIQRILEIVPGLLTWSFILSPVWLGLLYPQAIVYLLTFLTVYWSYMAIRQTAGMIVGYPKYKKEMDTNWNQKINDLNFSELPEKNTLPESLDNTKHLILVPAVNEPAEVLQPAFEAFLNQTYPTKRITLVYTIEEKYAGKTKETINEIIGDRRDKFEEILMFVHPSGIPGEAIGAGAANRTWGAKHAVQHLKDTGKDIRNYIFSTFDADHVPDIQYMARLTHLYLTTEARDNRFYATAVHLFDNNHWKVPTMMRIEANFVTLGTLASRSLSWGLGPITKDTFAAYSTSLQTLVDADYWDVSLGVDDTIFFWRAFFVRDGDFKAAVHFIPYSADAVEGETYLKAHVSLYRQLLRWGWGVIEVPYSVKRFLTNRKISLLAKLTWVFDHIKTRVFLINIVFLITFGFALLTLANPNVKQSSFAYSVPDIMSVILTFTLVFLLPGVYYRSKITKPMPQNWPIWKKFLHFGEGFIVIINLLTFSFFPFLDAQTRMLFGKKMKDLYYTQKIRR